MKPFELGHTNLRVNERVGSCGKMGLCAEVHMEIFKWILMEGV